MKINNLQDSTDSFIVKQLLNGMSKKYKREDLRKPISAKILTEMLRVLPVVCSSTYESKLFSTICVLTFCALLRIGEVVDSGNANHVLQRHDIILNQHDKSVSVTINSSKTDQYGNKTNLVLTNGHTGVLVFDVMQQYMAMRPNINGVLFVI